MAKNIIEKIWDEHVVYEEEGKPDLALYRSYIYSMK